MCDHYTIVSTIGLYTSVYNVSNNIVSMMVPYNSVCMGLHNSDHNGSIQKCVQCFDTIVSTMHLHKSDYNWSIQRCLQ